MILFHHGFKFLMILICSFQMAYGAVLSGTKRLPATASSPGAKDQLIESMVEFKKSLVGHIDNSHCEREETPQNEIDEVIDASFFDLVNSCSEANAPAGNQEGQALASHPPCEPISEEGIKQLIIPLMQERDENKEPYYLSQEHVNQVVRYRDFKTSLEDLLNRSDLSDDDKRELLYSYIENIVLSVRHIWLISMNEEDRLPGLMPEFNQSLFSDDQLKETLELGPNPAQTPFFVTLKSLPNNKATIEVNNLKRFPLDILQLMETETYQNYFKALRKSTLLMVLSQIQLYDAISGQESGVEIPRSCQTPLNGNMPESIAHHYNENREFGDTILTNILQEYRLAFGNDDDFLAEYYQNADIDPLYDAFGQLTPFEQLRNAELALNHRSQGLFDEVKLDDMAHFDRVIAVLDAKVKDLYAEGDTFRYGYNRGQEIERDYIGLKVWDQIIKTPEEGEEYSFEDEAGQTISFVPGWDNLSTFLANYLVRKKATSLEDVLSEQIKNRLQENRIRLDFPGLYGSPVWRQWGLQQMAFAFEDISSDEASTVVTEVFQHYCSMSQMSTREVFDLCQRSLVPGVEGNLFAYLAEKLAPFKQTENYIPLDRIEELGIKELWPFLNALWVTDYFAAYSSMNEYDFLMAQLYAGNSWARVRLSYLVAKEELSEQPQHYNMQYESRLFGLSRVPDRAGQCFNAAMIEENTKFNRIGSLTGLNRKLDLNYAETLLGNREVESLWADIKDDIDESGKQLFTAKRSDSSTYMTIMDQINNYTIADREALRSAEQSIENFNLDRRARTELEETFNSELGLRGDFFMGLYRLRNNMDEQIAYYTNYLREHDITVDGDIKSQFVKLDNDIKMSVYKSLLRESAVNRRAQLMEQLDQICQFAPDNHDELKTFFYMNAKAQNQLNELAGLPSVPEAVMKRLEGWTSEDWTMLRDGILAGVLGIGAVIAATACTTSVVCGVAAAAAGSAAFFQARLISYEYRKWSASPVHVERIRRMEELGLTDTGNHRELKHGWFMLAFEAVSMIPIIGISARGLQMGGRLTKSLPVLRESGLRGYRESVNAANEMSDVRYSLTVLKNGFNDEQLAIIQRAEDSASAEIRDIISRHQRGLITRLEMDESLLQVRNRFLNSARQVGHDFIHQLDDIAVNLTAREVDNLTIAQLIRFHGTLDSFAKEFTAISGRKLDNAVMRMEQKLPNANRVNAWFIRMRSDHLYQYRDAIREIQTNLDEAIRNGRSLEQFLTDNLDNLTNLHSRAPFRKRTVPHMVFVQGATHGMEFGLGRFQHNLMGGIADSILTKKVFQARARILTEVYRREAKTTLNLSENAGSLKTYKVFRAFNQKIVDRVSDTTNDLTNSARSEIIGKYQRLQDAAAREVWESVSTRTGARGEVRVGRKTYRFDENRIKEILFNPRSLEDEVVAEQLWASVDVHKILDIEELPQMAHEAARHLSNYKNISEFEDYLSAVRVLVMDRTPDVVDFL